MIPTASNDEYFERLHNFVISKRDASKRFRSAKMDRWLDHYEAYSCYLRTDNNYPWRARIYYPLIFSAIELKLSKAMNAIFSGFPLVQARAVQPQWQELAWIVTQLIGHQMEAEMKLLLPYTEHLKGVYLYGTGAAFVPYRVKSKMVKERIVQQHAQFLNAVPVPQVIEQLNVIETYNGPAFEPMDIADFYPSPGSKNVDDMPWTIRRVDLTWSDIKDAMNQGEYIRSEVGKLKDLIVHREVGGPSEVYDVVMDADEPRLNAQRAAIAKSESWRDRSRIAALEFYGPANLEVREGGEERPACITICKDYPIVLRAKPDLYPSRPFIVERDYVKPNELYGLAEGDVLRGLQAGINTTLNQMVDNMSLIINRMWMVGGGAHIDENEFLSVPGKIFHVDGDLSEALKPVEGRDLPRSPFSLMDFYRAGADQGVGQYDVTRGNISKTPATTATAVVHALAQGNTRFELDIRQRTQGGLVALADKMLELDQQFLPIEKVIQTLDRHAPEWLQVTLPMITGKYRFYPVATVTMGDKSGTQRALMEAKAMLDNDPILGQLYDRVELARQIMSSMDIPHIGQILPQRGAAPALQQMMQGGMQNGSGAGNGSPTNGVGQGDISGAGQAGVAGGEAGGASGLLPAPAMEGVPPLA